MIKENQIEEMALVLCRPRNIVKMIHHRTCGNCDTSSCDIYELCVDLYNAGYRKQSEGEWSRFEVNSSKGYGQVYYQHKDCDFNATQLFPSPYYYCPNCGAKMKGGGEV